MANGKTNKKPVYVYTDDDGDTIKEQSDIVQYWKERFQGEQGGQKLKLSDEQVWTILQSVHGDESKDEEVKDARMEALVDANSEGDEDFSVTAIGASEHMLAIDFASKLSEKSDADLEKAADSEEGKRAAVVEAAWDFAKDWNASFDDDGYVVECAAVDEMPIPGSSEEDTPAGPTPSGKNRRPADHYTWLDNTGKERTGRFIRDLVTSTPAGKDLMTRIQELKLMSGDKYDKTAIHHKEYLNDEYVTNEGGIRDSELDRLQSRLTSRVGTAAKAIAFLQVSNRIHRELPKINWGFTVPNGPTRLPEVAIKRKPICLVAAGKTRERASLAPWAVTTFNSLQQPSKKYGGRIRLDVIKERGGKLSDVVEVMKRPPKEEPTPGTEPKLDAEGKNEPMPTPQRLYSFFAMLETGLDPGEKQKNKAASDLYRAGFQKYFNQQTSDIDEELLVIQDGMVSLQELLRPYAARMERARNKQADKGQAAA